MEEIQIRTSKQNYIFPLIGAIGFVVAGLFITLTSNSSGDRWIGLVGIIFFGSMIPLFIKGLSEAKPRMIINDQGIFDRTFGVGTIPWSEITSAFIKSIKGNDFICLELRNPKIWSNQLSGIKKASASANKALGFTEFSMSISGATEDASAILELILKKIAEQSFGNR